MSNRLRAPRAPEGEVRSIPARNLELEQVRIAVRDIRHGEVRVVIQDGLIIQIDRLEKHRLV